MERTTVVDFVAKGDSLDEWQMVLVEEGSWEGEISSHLRRVQGRLYGCLDAAIEGKLAEKFPESKGKNLLIRLDCYNVPKEAISAFFDRFSKGVLSTPDYQGALNRSPYINSVRFEITFDAIH